MIRTALIYVFAVLLGLAAGFLEITINDFLVTAIFIMFATMVLGFMRPSHAWRWALIVGVFVPALRFTAAFFLGQYVSRAQKWEAPFALVIGAVGAYAGVLGRLGVDTLFRGQEHEYHPDAGPGHKVADH